MVSGRQHAQRMLFLTSVVIGPLRAPAAADVQSYAQSVPGKKSENQDN